MGQPAQKVTRTGPWGVLVLYSPDKPLTRRFIAIGNQLRIGRIPEAVVELAINDQFVSTAHATIRKLDRPDRFEIVDHGSTNGTFVEAEQILQQTLKEGDIIRTGHTLFEFGRRWDDLPQVAPHPELVGETPRFLEALVAADRVAATALGVLLFGETGTGKELFARRIHANSGRRGRLVTVNCGAIPHNLIESYLFGHKKGAFTGAVETQTGVIEEADSGTLFLDEIGELPLDLQPRLLRVLETRDLVRVGDPTVRRIDVRFIAATNARLEEQIKSGTFRPDLYARLAEFRIDLPPLRERRPDIPLLAETFLSNLDDDPPPLSGSFVEALLRHNWPMNVRELRAVIQRLAVMGDESEALRAANLQRGDEDNTQTEMQSQTDDARPLPRLRGPPNIDELKELLARYGGNVAEVARMYNTSRSQVYRWLKRYELQPEDFRE